MGKRYLIDSNILVDFQEQALPPSGQSFVAGIIDEEFNMSIINRIEILGYKDVTEQTKNFIALATVYDLTEKIADATINIRRNSKIKLPDAIIAATAQVYDFVIVTRNKKDFHNIKKVAVIDPYTLSIP